MYTFFMIVYMFGVCYNCFGLFDAGVENITNKDADAYSDDGAEGKTDITHVEPEDDEEGYTEDESTEESFIIDVSEAE